MKSNVKKETKQKGKKTAHQAEVKTAKGRKNKAQKAVNKTISVEKKQRQRKEIVGFTSHHKEILSFLLQEYENGGTNQSFDTGLAAFARFVYKSKILCYDKGSGIKTLSMSSLDTEVREAWREVKEERKAALLRKKEPNKRES